MSVVGAVSTGSAAVLDQGDFGRGPVVVDHRGSRHDKKYKCIYPHCISRPNTKRNNIERHVWTQHIRDKFSLSQERYMAGLHKDHVDRYVSVFWEPVAQGDAVKESMVQSNAASMLTDDGCGNGYAARQTSPGTQTASCTQTVAAPPQSHDNDSEQQLLTALQTLSAHHTLHSEGKQTRSQLHDILVSLTDALDSLSAYQLQSWPEVSAQSAAMSSAATGYERPPALDEQLVKEPAGISYAAQDGGPTCELWLPSADTGTDGCHDMQTQLAQWADPKGDTTASQSHYLQHWQVYAALAAKSNVTVEQPILPGPT